MHTGTDLPPGRTAERRQQNRRCRSGRQPPRLPFTEALLPGAGTIPTSEWGREAQGGGDVDRATQLGGGGWVQLQNLSCNNDAISTTSDTESHRALTER